MLAWAYSLLLVIARAIVTKHLANATSTWAKPKQQQSLRLSAPPPAHAHAAAADDDDESLEEIGVVRALKFVSPSGQERLFGDAAEANPAVLNVLDDSFFVRVCTRFDVGFGEAYLAGEIESPDLLRVLLFLVHLRDTTKRISKPQFSLSFSSAALTAISSVGRLTQLLNHWARRNSVDNTRQNIAEHYDLGNDFFRLFLDHETMAYSCALYDDEHQTLESAQANKIARLASLLQLRPKKTRTNRVLEVGNGWGALSVKLAQSGHSVTGLTLSLEQQRHVVARAEALHLDDRIETLLEDYRLHTPEQPYDGIVSCEMLEAVGHEFLPAFFEHMDRLLVTGGRLVLQVIITPDHRYERYRNLADFVQLYVFPGGLCPSFNAISAAIGGTKLVIEHVDNIGPHYAPTLHEWRNRFEANLDQVRALGFDERFIRIWRYYLIYCEAAFETRTMNLLHIVMRKH
jgi:cyclopropane-fatty-acyl-phospholipid synthase